MVVEQAQPGPGSQAHTLDKLDKASTFENVDINPFIVVKEKHKTAAKVQLKRPNILNPVQDPRQRDHSIGGSSNGDEQRSMQNSSVGGRGYMSGGMVTDTESARLSNVQPYKFNSNR